MFKKVFSFMIALMLVIFVTASTVSTARAESVNNKGSTSQIQMMSITAETNVVEVMNFDQRQPMVANYAPSHQSLSNMNLQNAQMTKHTAIWSSKEQFQLMQARPISRRAINFSLNSTTAQFENTQQVMMNNSTIILSSMMNLNFGKERFKKGSIVILKKPIMMSSSLSTQTCSSDVKKIASGGAQLKICSLNLTSANCPIHSTASINKAEVTSIET